MASTLYSFTTPSCTRCCVRYPIFLANAQVGRYLSKDFKGWRIIPLSRQGCGRGAPLPGRSPPPNGGRFSLSPNLAAPLFRLGDAVLTLHPTLHNLTKPMYVYELHARAISIQ